MLSYPNVTLDFKSKAVAEAESKLRTIGAVLHCFKLFWM